MNDKLAFVRTFRQLVNVQDSLDKLGLAIAAAHVSSAVESMKAAASAEDLVLNTNPDDREPE